MSKLLKIRCGVLLGLLALGLMVGLAGAVQAITLDDVAKDVTTLKVAVAGLTARMDSLDAGNGRLFTLTLSLFGIIIAILSGMAWTLIGLSKDIRTPKEESKMKEMLKTILDNMQVVNEKLHLPHIPKSVLVFLIGLSLLLGLTSASWAVPNVINVQGWLA